MPSERPFTLRVAEYFRAHPNQWIDGDVLRDVGGKYAYRTRISNCRVYLGMTIENRQRRVPANDEGGYFVVSEYKYVPDPATGAAPFDANGFALRAEG